jgi:hypothetical protein
MATCVWKGVAPAIAQVVTVTVGGTIEATDIFNMTINGKTLSVVAGSTVAATVATAIAAAWNALSATSWPEFAEITALATTGGAFTLTADTAGVPFAVTLATTETGGGAADDQTFTQSATTANSGPNDWSVAANWSGGAVPVDDDTIVFENSITSALYGLDQSAITADLLTIKQSFTGTIGLPRTNAAGYVEYRDTYLAISPDVVDIGGGEGIGSGRIKINTGSVQTALTVLNSGTGLDSGVYAVVWKGTHASNAVALMEGELDIAPFASEVATCLTLRQGESNAAKIRCGSGVTVGTITNTGGNMIVDTTTAAVTAITQTAGELTINGMTNAVTSLTVWGGVVKYNTAGTLTAGIVGSGATLDFRGDMRAKTVTALTRYDGADIQDPAAIVTWTNGIDFSGCEGIVGLGKHRTWTPTAI